ncbi:MAG TPA: aquaporin [Gemmatimonadaceae bacterium]|nr:aquaporin [Gemmatimonadaceae bacterium]
MTDSPPLARRLAAELLGTALLVLVGTGCVMTNVIAQGALGLTGIALTWGFLVTALIATIGGISGAHINPAVTIALAVTGKFPAREVAGYVLAQCAGASLASLILLATLGNVSSLGATIPTVSVGATLAIEFWLSFVLMATVVGATSDERWGGGGAAVVIGMAVALDVLMGGPLTGASMNPARSLGPALIGQRFDSLWIYWVAPIAGMIAAALALRWLRSER